MALTFLQKLFPHSALRREVSRKQLEVLQGRSYDAGTPTDFRKPVGADGSPQTNTATGGEALRKYARNLDENHDLAIGVLDALVNNVIGTGLPIQPMIRNLDGSLNNDINQRMAYILADWSRRPVADGITSFVEAQRLLCRSWLRDGEVLINKIKGNSPGFRHRGAVPLSIELLESDYLPYLLNATTPKLIVQGVEMTGFYAPTAYYLAKVHPGDMWQQGFGSNQPNDYKRIEAEKIIHLKFTRRINQVRGVSILHGVIRRLEDIKDYEESERIAARVAAAFSAFIKKSPEAATVRDADTGKRQLEMSPGMIFDNLLPGEEIGTIDSNRPNPEVNNFIMGQMKRVSTGTMTNYSTISRDYNGSYSSQRQSMVEAKPGYDALRKYVADTLAHPIYADLVEMAVLSGALRLPAGIDRDTLADAEISNVPMPWIDPKKEVEADNLAVQGGLTSISQVIRGRGGDPLTVAKQRETDRELFEDVAQSAINTEPEADEKEGEDDEESKETEPGAEA